MSARKVKGRNDRLRASWGTGHQTKGFVDSGLSCLAPALERGTPLHKLPTIFNVMMKAQELWKEAPFNLLSTSHPTLWLWETEPPDYIKPYLSPISNLEESAVTAYSGEMAIARITSIRDPGGGSKLWAWPGLYKSVPAP